VTQALPLTFPRDPSQALDQLLVEVCLAAARAADPDDAAAALLLPGQG